MITLRGNCFGFSPAKCFLASFPGLLPLQFLIVCSVQNRERMPGDFDHVIHGMASVMDSRLSSLFTFLVAFYREAICL